MLVHDFLINSANRFPDKEALLHAGKRYTYSQILSGARTISNLLQQHEYKPDFRGAILTDDPFEYITAYFGILMAGGIAVGLNTQTSSRSLKAVLSDCSPSVMFLRVKFERYLKTLPQEIIENITVFRGTTPDRKPATNIPQAPSHTKDLAQIIYTSGTTGKPKGVMLRHSNFVANTNSIIKYLGLTENDRVMAVLPFFYSYGNSVLLTHIAVGGSLVVNQNFLYPNVILDEMVREQVTGFSGVPSTFAILLNRSAVKKYSFPSLRYLTQAGAAMSPTLAHKLQKVFHGIPIFIMYGQTEAAARLSYLDPKDLYAKAGSIGKAIPGVTLQLLDKQGVPVQSGETGEIVATGENIMAGYWNKPEETAQILRPEGLWTGDLARQDDEGYFFIISRKSDMIKSGSHRIAPKEIEEIIYEHEAVHEVAVVGVEDEILGEAIKACIVLKKDQTCTEKDILRHCKKNLPAFKIPHQITFMVELPKTVTGKIKKGDL